FKNPISVAQLILQKSDEGPLSLGRIPPIMLTGSGATQWYHTMGFNHLDRVLPELPNSIVLTELKKLCTNHNTNTDTDADNNNNCNTNSSNSNNDVKNSNNNDNNNDDDDGDDTCSLNGSLVTRESLRRYAKFSAMLTASHPQKSLALQATSTLTQPGNSTINTSTLNNDIAVHNPESSSRPPIPETQAVTMMMKRKASIGRGKEEEEEEEEERDKVNKRSSSYLKQPPQHQQQQQQQQRQQQQQHQNLSQPKYGGNIKQVLEEEEGEEINDLLQDTVGAICVDSWGRVAAGVSSGGIAMKFPGRAALYGTGCWAQDPTISSGGFACSMTGAGEQISKTLLARTCMDTFLQEDDIAMATTDVLDRFIHSPLLKSYEDRYAGFIAVKVEPSSSVAAAVEGSITNSNKDRNEPLQPLRTEFVFAHTTKTM
ncbi:taspase, threonine aspartase, 1, partial [Lobosporangium transversale]